MKMLIGICNASKPDAARLHQMIEYCLTGLELDDGQKITAEIRHFHNGLSLLAQFEPGAFHVLVLDVFVPELNGVRCAEIVRERDLNCEIVFTASAPDYALRSFDVRAAGYLLKPYSLGQVAETLDRCRRKLSDRLRTLEVTSEREKINLPLCDIISIEIYGRTSIVHTRRRDILTNRSLNSLESDLGDPFLRCHRSYIVNMEYVNKLLDTEFVMIDGSEIPIAIDKKIGIKKHYFDWLFQRTWENGLRDAWY